MPIFDGKELDTELVIIPEIKNLHHELVTESIKEQMSDPFGADMNQVAAFREQIEETLEDDELDDTAIRKINDLAHKFYMDVIELIDEKFNLECDTETIAEKSNEDIADICEALYCFFILKHGKYIKNILLKYIVSNMKQISTDLDYLRKKKDVTTMSLKKKVDDPELSLVLSNLHEVVNYILELDDNMSSLIQYLDLGNFNILTVNELMESSVIADTFQALYFEPLKGFQDSNYDYLMSKIEAGLIKIYRNGKD